MATKAHIARSRRPAKFLVRQYNRCEICGRPRAVYRKFHACRVCVRQLALEGKIPGMVKSSW